MTADTGEAAFEIPLGGFESWDLHDRSVQVFDP